MDDIIIQIDKQIYSEKEFPLEWAETQIKISSALIELSSKSIGEEDAIKNMIDAIECLKSTNRVYTENKFPNKWAWVNLRLAKVFEKLNEIHGSDVYSRIEYLENALKIYTETEYPEEWAEIQLSFAEIGYISGYYQYLTKLVPDGYYITLSKEKINKPIFATYYTSISFFENSMRVYSEISFPIKYAYIQTKLGDIYKIIGKLCETEGDKIKKFELSFDSYQNALAIYTRNGFEKEVAEIKLKFAESLLIFPTEDFQSNRHLVIALFLDSLKTYKKSVFASEYAYIQKSLGKVYEEIEELTKACKAYSLAVFAYRKISDKNSETNAKNSRNRIRDMLILKICDRKKASD